MKVQFGCGGNILEGWENHDLERDGVDIRKRLPYENGTVEKILAEHVVEHVNAAEAYLFFEECNRILTPRGLLRIVVPSPARIELRMTSEYLDFCEKQGWGRNAIKTCFTGHGHQSAWTLELLTTAIRWAGFNIFSPLPWPEEGHGKVIGDKNNEIESIGVTGAKP